MSTTKIISGFAGIGKTHLTNIAKEATKGLSTNPAYLDLDSSTFSKLPDGTANPDFPKNYVDVINDTQVKGSTSHIFVSAHQEVRDLLKPKHTILVYPHISCKSEYIDRYKMRNNTDYFVDMMDKNWDIFIKSMQKSGEKFNSIVLAKGMFLSDILN